MASTAEFIANVQTEVDGLKNKIKELEGRKAGIDSEIAQARAEIKRRCDLLLVWEGKADVQQKRAARTQRAPRSGSMTQVALEILEGAGRPMNVHDILDGLVARGAAGSSKNPISSVRNTIQILKKQGRVVSAGYGLVGLTGK